MAERTVAERAGAVRSSIAPGRPATAPGVVLLLPLSCTWTGASSSSENRLVDVSVFEADSVAFVACTVASVRTSPVVLETVSDVEISELSDVLVPEEPDVLDEDELLSFQADQAPVPVAPSTYVPVPMPVKRFIPSAPMFNVVPLFLLALPPTI